GGRGARWRNPSRENCAMTEEEFWKSWFAFWIVGGGPFLLGVISIGYTLYLSRCHLDAMKDALKNSRYIYLWGPSLGRRGVIWTLLEIAKIAGMVTWSKTYIRIGDVNAADLESFPPYLKRLLIIDTAMKVIGFTWLIIVAVLLKFK
ncbi:hypothetical protein, partial [Pseudomonas lactis]|uniref:hypothetical protein n=6 Tax=Pseudomonas lactis TaxID=1615674 RepID=UPI001F1ECBFF